MNARRELHALREELHGLAEEMEREACASSIDVRYRWDRLKLRIEDFEERSRTAGQSKVPYLRRTALHLRESIERLRADCRH